jgi:hypothetical protein
LIRVIVLLTQSILDEKENRNIIKADSDSFHPNTILPTDINVIKITAYRSLHVITDLRLEKKSCDI